MNNKERRILSEEEKQDLLKKHHNCYICGDSLIGYPRKEIEFDHIYNYADGYPQDLSNFAPVHASPNENKLNCHRGKGRKTPFDYREELQIKKILRNIHGIADLCKSAIPSVFSISLDNHNITFNNVQLPLYNQKVNGRDNVYFFHEIETKYIENDNEIQLRPLEDKILPLIFNLKSSVQLLPSLARLDPKTNTVKLFDGQHKAVAQIIGNKKDRIPCIVFVNPDVNSLRITVYEAHTDFVQQRYKKSHIDAKLSDIYGQKIEAFRKKLGNPQAPYTEEDILKGETASDVRDFILASIIKEVSVETDIIRLYAAESRKDQKHRPILWQSLERFISKFCSLKAVDTPSESSNNYRSEEIDNLVFILRQIEDHAIRNKWNPDNPESERHKLARTFFLYVLRTFETKIVFC